MDKWITTADVIKLTGLSPSVLQGWRRKGKNFRFEKRGGRVYYLRSDVVKYLGGKAWR